MLGLMYWWENDWFLINETSSIWNISISLINKWKQPIFYIFYKTKWQLGLSITIELQFICWNFSKLCNRWWKFCERLRICRLHWSIIKELLGLAYFIEKSQTSISFQFLSVYWKTYEKQLKCFTHIYRGDQYIQIISIYEWRMPELVSISKKKSKMYLGIIFGISVFQFTKIFSHLPRYFDYIDSWVKNRSDFFLREIAASIKNSNHILRWQFMKKILKLDEKMRNNSDCINSIGINRYILKWYR